MTLQYLRLSNGTVLRYIARHRLLALLNVLSVALGLAVYLAIQIANQSANGAFAASIDLVAGKATLQVSERSLPPWGTSQLTSALLVSRVFA